MKRIHKIYTFILALSVAFLLPGCVDTLDAPTEISDGVSTVGVNVGFKAFTPALKNTRAAGTAIKNINTLWVVIYTPEGEFLEKREITSFSKQEVVDRPKSETTVEQQTGHVEFNMTLKNGRYLMYAVANYDLADVADDKIATPDLLKNLDLTWDEEKVENNAQMLGFFSNSDDVTTADAEPVVINGNTTKLHAWVTRAASKLTIGFDTQKLRKNIAIYIKSVTIKDIPTHCYLGADNNVGADGYTLSKKLIEDGETIYFGEGESTDEYRQWRKLTKETIYWGYRSEVGPSSTKDFAPEVTDAESLEKRRVWEHSDIANALYFYENLQGEGKDKAQTAPGPGNGDGSQNNAIGFPNPDENVAGSGWKDEKPFGSYIEVDAFYVSTADGNVCQGPIKYRFMLGQDIKTDYNARRNYHYMLTLQFNGNANDYDWHIDFTKMSPVFDVDEPHVMNYQGKYFVPQDKPSDRWYNKGNLFEENVITVKSYTEDDKGSGPKQLKYNITYRDQGQGNFTPKEPSWMTMTKDEANSNDLVQQYKFSFHDDYTDIDIDAKLKGAKAKSESQSAPYNLAADPNSYSATSVYCTANCYMIDAPGWYMFPLVYGNAYHNGNDNEKAYKYQGADATTPSKARKSTRADEEEEPGDAILQQFVNHLNNPIKAPYIRDNEKCGSPTGAQLVWQDAQDLVNSVEYVASAYNNKGGIKFYVNKDKIQQGNCVISLRGKDANNQDCAMWSWHIWVTRLDVEEQDKTVTITNRVPLDFSDDEDNLDPSVGSEAGKYKILPVNLGWCSHEVDIWDIWDQSKIANKIRYYPEKTCEVMFTPVPDEDDPLIVKEVEPIIIKVIKKSHIVFPRGNNPYYQWGRKDPFLGAMLNWGNKTRWEGTGKETWDAKTWYVDQADPATYYPKGLTPPTTKAENNDSKRLTTRQALHLLIQKPDIWHNPTRKPYPWSITEENKDDPTKWKYYSTNRTYDNLWSGKSSKNLEGPTYKTVYDPCPVGYQIPNYKVFTGFTMSGNSVVDPNWSNMLPVDNIRKGLLTEAQVQQCGEFYTDATKLQSVIFPMTGYRDWDANALPYHFGYIGYAWEAEKAPWAWHGYPYSYNLEFARADDNVDKSYYVRPTNVFFDCDGFPVRPVVSDDSHGSALK